MTKHDSMAWFKKKKDPISERARDLTKQIADLEGQIRKLSVQQSKIQSGAGTAGPPESTSAKFNPRQHGASPPEPPPAPKLRSTARPKSPTVFLPKTESIPPSASSTPDEPIFEEMGRNPFRSGSSAPRSEGRNHLDIRRNDLFSLWRRFKSNFRGPATSNPKLVNYLAAGSIQGLRPLRYERRVARNRFLVLVAVLILVLWGIVALIFFR